MRWRLIPILLALLLTSSLSVAAQADLCTPLVQDALAQMGDNCSGLNRNSACYGFTRVESTFTDEQAPDFFTLPADRAALVDLKTLATRPLDLDLAQWGIAVMSAQANIPGALPGQAVIFLLLGDTEVTNAVEPSSAPTPLEPVTVTLQSETRVFTAPDRNSNVLTSLAVGTAVAADALSADGDWLRVLTESGLGWIRRQTVTTSDALSNLAAVESGVMTPMQAFQLETAFDDLSCSEAPSLLALQGPEGLTVDLTANGAHIRMASLVVLRTLPPGDSMQLFTVEGDVVLEPESDTPLPLPPNFSTTHCLDDNGNIGTDCPWTAPQPLTEEEQLWVEIVLAAYAELEPAGETVIVEDATCPDGTTLQHTVESGDTLFSLSQRYNTTVSAIVYRNNLTSSLIYVGQGLDILCGEVGPASLPPGFDDPPDNPQPPNPPQDPNPPGSGGNQDPPRSPNNPANPPPTATPPRITR